MSTIDAFLVFYFLMIIIAFNLKPQNCTECNVDVSAQGHTQAGPSSHDVN